MSSKLRLAPIAALAAILLAACGSSSHSTLTRAELVAQADPICKQVAVSRKAANDALSKVGSSTSKELRLLARVAPGVATLELQAVERLRSLKPQSSLSHEWQQLLDGMHQLASDAVTIGADAKANKLKSIESITSAGKKLRERLTTIASRNGFTYCGRTS
jgi:ABC-type enterochelin transport system substrate-binding protein